MIVWSPSGNHQQINITAICGLEKQELKIIQPTPSFYYQYSLSETWNSFYNKLTQVSGIRLQTSNFIAKSTGYSPAAHTWPSLSVSPDVQLQVLLRFLWKRIIFQSWLIQWKQELSPFRKKTFNATELPTQCQVLHSTRIRNLNQFLQQLFNEDPVCARTVCFSSEYLGLPNIT